MIDDRTSTLNLPKPNKDNTLIDDVQRLRDALDGADAAIAGKAGTVHGHAISDVSGLSDALAAKQDSLGFSPENPANKGAANGYASLDSGGKVPATQLPSYVDDVLEYANLASFPGAGETGKIYVALDTNKTYRWSGSAYAEISASPGSTDAVTEGSTNLYFTVTRAKLASAYGGLNKSAGYAITAADSKSMLRVNTASGAVTITLPQISTLTQDFDTLVAKVTGDTNAVVIARSGTDTINGATTYNLSSQWQGAWLIADRSTNTWTVISSGASASNAIVDQFTGAGSAGPFTLSADPGSKNNTAVFVGGVYQQKSTYTLTGTSLTLGGTVAAGVSIEVCYTTPLSIGTPADGTVTTAKIAPGAVTAEKVGADVAGSNNIGYIGIPQNPQSANYTLTLSDAGKHILHPSADTTARTFTIPANSAVAYPIGTAITFVNQNGAGTVTIAITTDTMRLAGAGTTGSRTLTANGVATALKITATEWIISGTNLT